MDVGTSEKKQKLFTWLNSGNEDFCRSQGRGRSSSSKSPTNLAEQLHSPVPHVYTVPYM